VTSDFRPEVDILLFRACAMYPAIIIGAVRFLWTWLWGIYHVPRNIFTVPGDFARVLVIPLLKNVDGNQFVSENYRGITLSPVISKLFVMVIMAVFEK